LKKKVCNNKKYLLFIPDKVYKIGKVFNPVKIYLLSFGYISLDVTANTMLLLMYEKCIVYNIRKLLQVFKINTSHLAIGEAIS
jgi:hypothetical protein